MLEELKKRYTKQICFYPNTDWLHLPGEMSARLTEKLDILQQTKWCGL